MKAEELLRRYQAGVRDFQGMNLRGQSFKGQQLSGANFSGADLRGTNFSGADLSRANLSSADLSSANLRSANLSSADLSSADLSSAFLSSAFLSSANLSSANLSGANLSNANLSEAIISDETLIDEKWKLVHQVVNESGKGKNLSGVDLSSANLSTADLSGADLNGANLHSANLSSANLSGANLSGANLSSANLSNANLSNANLSDLDVTNTFFGEGLSLSEDEKALLKQKGGFFSESTLYMLSAPSAMPSHTRRDLVTIQRAGDTQNTGQAFQNKSVPRRNWLKLPFSEKAENIENFEISLLYARRLAKGFSTSIRVHIYLPSVRPVLETMIIGIRERERKEQTEERRESSNLKPGMTVIVSLSSPAIQFSSERVIQLSSNLNAVSFNALPIPEFPPGWQSSLLSIRDSNTQVEYESIPFSCKVDDYAFDHVSRPFASYVTSGVTGLVAIVIGSLTVLGKVDTAMGAPAGTTLAAVSTYMGVRPTWLYQQKTKNSD